MRQMMHGAIRFDSKEVAGLGGLIAPLRAAVAADLKRHLGTPAHEPPLVTSQAMMIVHPAFGLGGTRAIKTADITPLIT
jgi:hypothetical protein